MLIVEVYNIFLLEKLMTNLKLRTQKAIHCTKKSYSNQKRRRVDWIPSKLLKTKKILKVTIFCKRTTIKTNTRMQKRKENTALVFTKRSVKKCRPSPFWLCQSKLEVIDLNSCSSIKSYYVTGKNGKYCATST